MFFRALLWYVRRFTKFSACVLLDLNIFTSCVAAGTPVGAYR